MRAAFVYSHSKRELASAHAAGAKPDSQLLGQNHLADFGVDAEIYDPLLTRRQWQTRRAQWAAWYGRELTLPLELPKADVVFTSLRTAYPLVERRRRVFVLNHSICRTLARGGRQRRLVLASTRACAGIVCFAEAQRRTLIEQTGLSPDRVHVNLMCVDPTYFFPPEVEPGDFVLAAGNTGRDYATFVEAMRDLPYRAIVLARPSNAEGLDIPPNVEFEFGASLDRYRELYARARCVALPTFRDDWAFGADTPGATTLTEAMAMGKAIVTSDHPWVREYVDDSSARLVTPEEPGDLREAIAATFEDESLRESLGSEAWQTVQDRLTSRHYAERLASIFRGHPPPAPVAGPVAEAVR